MSITVTEVIEAKVLLGNARPSLRYAIANARSRDNARVQELYDLGEISPELGLSMTQSQAVVAVRDRIMDEREQAKDNIENIQVKAHLKTLLAAGVVTPAGAIVGGVAGFALAGPIGAIVGAAVPIVGSLILGPNMLFKADDKCDEIRDQRNKKIRADIAEIASLKRGEITPTLEAINAERKDKAEAMIERNLPKRMVMRRANQVTPT